MNSRERVTRLIKKSQSELAYLQQEHAMQVKEKEGFIRALKETLKFLPQEAGDEQNMPTLRPGSLPHRVFQYLKSEGRPRHVSEILAGLDMDADKKNRVSLTGTLGAYVRRGQFFSRPSPNTFGLLAQFVGDHDLKENEDRDDDIGIDLSDVDVDFPDIEEEAVAEVESDEGSEYDDVEEDYY